MLLKNLLSHTVLVFGLGKSGLAAAKVLHSYGANVIAYDEDVDKAAAASDLGITVKSLLHVDFSGVDFILWSPGIPHTLPTEHLVAKKARVAGVPIFCDIELFLRTVEQAKFVGISGTNGKSTTTTLIGHILSEAGENSVVAGNIGTPVFAASEPFDENKLNDRTYVLELSSYQLELTPSLDLDVAILLNITPDHLTRHGGMKGYVEAKTKLFSGKKRKTAIVSVDDKYSAEICTDLMDQKNIKVVPISLKIKPENGIYVRKNVLYDNTGDETVEVMPLDDLPHLPGLHNAQNIAAAYAAARALKIAPTKIIKAIRTFPGLVHRQELVGDFSGVKYINDSKATNADATEKALVCYDEMYLILGGLPKEDGISSLLPYMNKVKRVFLIGQASAEFAKTLEGHAKIYKCETLDVAVDLAASYAKSDLLHGKVEHPVVLLSPAAASFDQFKSFEQRGDVFKELVAKIVQKENAEPTSEVAHPARVFKEKNSALSIWWWVAGLLLIVGLGYLLSLFL